MSPDVLVTKGLEQRQRENYLLWQERCPPNIVIEVTSRSTRDEDLEDKFELTGTRCAWPNTLVDPRGDYLRPALQGYRLQTGRYGRIKRLSGRLPSVELGLHLEQHERQLRFWDPTTRRWLPTHRSA